MLVFILKHRVSLIQASELPDKPQKLFPPRLKVIIDVKPMLLVPCLNLFTGLIFSIFSRELWRLHLSLLPLALRVPPLSLLIWVKCIHISSHLSSDLVPCPSILINNCLLCGMQCAVSVGLGLSKNQLTRTSNGCRFGPLKGSVKILCKIQNRTEMPSVWVYLFHPITVRASSLKGLD